MPINFMTMADYSGQLNQERANDVKETVKKKPLTTKPVKDITDVEFTLVLFLAVLKDILDWVLLLIFGIGLILSRITNLVITGILWLWCSIRLHKFPTKRFLGGFVIEMIPVVGTFSPTWTIFIATIWIEQKGYAPKWATKLAKGKI